MNTFFLVLGLYFVIGLILGVLFTPDLDLNMIILIAVFWLPILITVLVSRGLKW